MTPPHRNRTQTTTNARRQLEQTTHEKTTRTMSEIRVPEVTDRAIHHLLHKRRHHDDGQRPLPDAVPSPGNNPSGDRQAGPVYAVGDGWQPASPDRPEHCLARVALAHAAARWLCAESTPERPLGSE